MVAILNWPYVTLCRTIDVTLQYQDREAQVSIGETAILIRPAVPVTGRHEEKKIRYW
jgi:hypothetical protein